MTGGNWFCLKSFDLNLKLQLYDVKLLRDQIPWCLWCAYVAPMFQSQLVTHRDVVCNLLSLLYVDDERTAMTACENPEFFTCNLHQPLLSSCLAKL
jgi:hypothetical protein